LTGARERVPELLARGHELLARDRGREAADVFGRVLLLVPESAEARAGLARARVLTVEDDRALEAQLDEAARALSAGDASRAAALASDVLARGGDRDRALALLDRIDPRRGVMEPARLPASSPLPAPPAKPGPARGRAVFTATCSLGFLLFAVGIGATWERLVVQLSRTPTPSSVAAPPVSILPAVSNGDRAVAEARRLIEGGDARGAVAVLDRVRPYEAAYPLARRLRDQAARTAGAAREASRR
jgi:hypothetical protein